MLRRAIGIGGVLLVAVTALSAAKVSKARPPQNAASPLADAPAPPAAAPAPPVSPLPPAVAEPKLPTAQQLNLMFHGKPSVDAYLAAGRSPDRLVNGALYYFLNLVDVLDAMDKRKGPRKEAMDDTISLLEEAVNAQPDNAVHVALLGNAYGLKVTFSGFPALLGWAKNCQARLARAVRLEPNNPEVRLLRLRSYAHFPYTYYPDLKPVVLDDANVVLKWADDVTRAKQGDPKASDTLANMRDIRNETLFMVGEYLHEQVKDDKAALSFLGRADAQCWKYCEMARSLSARLK